eukprot:CAMPEP_0170491370 /NCGR_PEP_ID=MMETSP0208-20121228/10894_1 /TAXON_ID=197538 /ORGANISM="Strombidium inclinatum, Strain S3" /LENGTH=82 /DNA_ID=CAMNT_0010766933 /DNA_START=19 /DNA_END=267 /DNA_ORIENTATION=+
MPTITNVVKNIHTITTNTNNVDNIHDVTKDIYDTQHGDRVKGTEYALTNHQNTGYESFGLQNLMVQTRPEVQPTNMVALLLI